MEQHDRPPSNPFAPSLSRALILSHTHTHTHGHTWLQPEEILRYLWDVWLRVPQDPPENSRLHTYTIFGLWSLYFLLSLTHSHIHLLQDICLRSLLFCPGGATVVLLWPPSSPSSAWGRAGKCSPSVVLHCFMWQQFSGRRDIIMQVKEAERKCYEEVTPNHKHY